MTEPVVSTHVTRPGHRCIDFMILSPKTSCKLILYRGKILFHDHNNPQIKSEILKWVFKFSSIQNCSKYPVLHFVLKQNVREHLVSLLILYYLFGPYLGDHKNHLGRMSWDTVYPNSQTRGPQMYFRYFNVARCR